MNIVFIYERKIIAEAGGVERVSSLLGNEFSRRGHNVSYISVGPPELNPEIPESEENKVEGSIPQYYCYSGDASFKEYMGEFLKKEEPDIAIIQSNDPSVMDFLPLLNGKVRKMLVWHNQPFASLGKERTVKKNIPTDNLFLKGKILRMMGIVVPGVFRMLNNNKWRNRYNALLPGIDNLILLSERYIPRIVRLMPGIDRSKLMAINNPNSFDIPENPDSFSKENIILFVGRLSNAQKNVTGFIDVWKIFHKSHPDWKAYILGDGEDRRYIENYASKKKVENFYFEGIRKNISDYYAKAKLLCMTSTYEGWPMVLAEAMAYGCVPVAYNSFEAVNDIVVSGESGILVSPFDTNAMARALSELADDDDLRLKLAENGRNKIQSFSVTSIVNQWERLFRN